MNSVFSSKGVITYGLVTFIELKLYHSYFIFYNTLLYTTYIFAYFLDINYINYTIDICKGHSLPYKLLSFQYLHSLYPNVSLAAHN